jgi:hypothetical protein
MGKIRILLVEDHVAVREGTLGGDSRVEAVL